MMKFALLIAALAAFFLAMAFYIVPEQGGLTSTTALQESDLQGADPRYEEVLPIQTVEMGRQGRSEFIAIAMLSHILLANVQLGGAWIILLTGYLYYRSRKDRYRRIGRSMALFNVILFSIGATFALGGMIFFASLFPVLTQNLFHIYWWPLFLEGLAFVGELFFLYSYWYTWGRISSRRHLLLGWGYAIDVFFQQLLINSVAAGMLTPGGESISWGLPGVLTMTWSTLMAWWNNTTVWFLTFHRLTGAVSFYGFLWAALAMFHFMDRKDGASKAYWDWVGTFGMAWGLLGLALQPGFGLMYMMQIFYHQQLAFTYIMHGPRAWGMLWMVALLSALLISSLIYFIDRHRSILERPDKPDIWPLLKVLLAFGVLAGLILVNPGWVGSTFSINPGATFNPAGRMVYKYIALFMVSVISALVVGSAAVILGNIKNEDWGCISRSARASGIFSGVLAMWLIITMGAVRESARSPWTVFQIIPVPGGTAYPTPISMWNIFLIWLGVLSFVLAVFWLISKVTAEHPGEADLLEPAYEAWH